MSAAVSLADRCLDPPENTSRIVGETVVWQGRVSACQWCMPFHGVHTQSLSGPRGLPSASESADKTRTRLIYQ